MQGRQSQGKAVGLGWRESRYRKGLEDEGQKPEASLLIEYNCTSAKGQGMWVGTFPSGELFLQVSFKIGERVS